MINSYKQEQREKINLLKYKQGQLERVEEDAQISLRHYEQIMAQFPNNIGLYSSEKGRTVTKDDLLEKIKVTQMELQKVDKKIKTLEKRMG